MDFVKEMREKAKNAGKILVLPEGTEPRTIQAARKIMDEKLASRVCLVGDTEAIRAAASAAGVSLEGLHIEDPEKSGKHEEYANSYYELRKHKGMSQEQAQVDISSPLRWGAMMVKSGAADAMVAGAESTTADVLRAGLMIIGTVPGLKT